MRRVTNYPKAIKANILTKLLAPNPPRMIDLAKELNIPYGTIVTWKQTMLKKQTIKQSNTPQRPHEKSPEAKLQAVMDTMGKTEEEQSAYCRTHGIYSHHLDAWKKQMLEGLGAKTSSKEGKAENKQAKNEVKKLQSDLRRKDKALAEVSALLILKKKADLLWGVDEDDS